MLSTRFSALTFCSLSEYSLRIKSAPSSNLILYWRSKIQGARVQSTIVTWCHALLSESCPPWGKTSEEWRTLKQNPPASFPFRSCWYIQCVWCYHYYMNTWRHCSHFNAELCTTIVIQFILIEDNLKIHRNTIQEINILAKPHQRRGSSPESWASRNQLQGRGLVPLSSVGKGFLEMIFIKSKFSK